MNALDFCILFYQLCVVVKFLTNVTLSITLLVLCSVVISQGVRNSTFETILFGMIACAILSLLYIVKTVLLRYSHILYETPRVLILAWAIVASLYLPNDSFFECRFSHLILAFAYIVAVLNLFIMKFPYGENGEFRA